MTVALLAGGAKLSTVQRVWRRIAVHDTVGSAESSFTWAGLNGDADESYMIMGRWVAPAPAGDDVLAILLNADTSAANYNTERLVGANTVISASKSPGTLGGLDLAEVLDNGDLATFTAFLSAKTGLNRTITVVSGSAKTATFLLETQIGQWLNTVDNITQIGVKTLFAASDIGIGSHFELWAPRRPGG